MLGCRKTDLNLHVFLGLPQVRGHKQVFFSLVIYSKIIKLGSSDVTMLCIIYVHYPKTQFMYVHG
jgi:hypothetical protein